MTTMRSAYGTPILVRPSESAVPLSAIELDTSGHGVFDEGKLQALIHAHPRCLPIEQIEPGLGQVVAICREMPTERGPIDNFLMTPEGDLVIVEAKLWRNPEARRKVVAQALDYTSCLFEMNYSDLEAAVLKGRFSDREKPTSLYDIFAGNPDVGDEAAFVDAVNSNLRKGRALVLVVGDGIRTDLVRLTSLLQSHAGARFTFALIELALFQMPSGEGTIACPRILAQTKFIERGIVTIEDGRVKIGPAPAQPMEDTAPAGKSISEEQFYEAMSQIDPNLPKYLRAFIARLEPLGVYPEYMRSLNLKWDIPDERPFNFGYIKRSGHLWTDASNWFGRKEIGHQYNESLAAAFGMNIDTESKTGWKIMTPDGHMPRIDEIVPNLDAWYGIIERFIGTLRAHYGQ